MRLKGRPVRPPAPAGHSAEEDTRREGRFFRRLTNQTRTEAQRKVLQRHQATTPGEALAPTRGHPPEVAPRSHGHAKRDDVRLRPRVGKRHRYAETA
jgi:hypothetical protein